MKIVNTVKRIITLNNAIERSAKLCNRMFDDEKISNEKLDVALELNDRLWDKLENLKAEVKSWERNSELTRQERIARRNQRDLVCRHLCIKWNNLR